MTQKVDVGRSTPAAIHNWHPVSYRRITRAHDEWPPGLSELGSLEPPRALHVYGRNLPLQRPCVAIVGTRRPSIAGLEAAEDIGRALAEAGFAIISGLAIGIDAMAHKAALESGGHSVAVIGCGADLNYPKRNEILRRRLDEDGSVVSEYELGVPPRPHHFPARNRVIVGLSQAVVVVEGAERSGALITGRLALEANRAVFAVPGSRRNPAAWAPNELIRTSQACPVTDPRHIFEELAPDLAWEEKDHGVGDLALDPHDAEVLCTLDDAPTAPDRIHAVLGISPGQLSLSLARLEIRGLATVCASGYLVTRTGARARARLSS